MSKSAAQTPYERWFSGMKLPGFEITLEIENLAIGIVETLEKMEQVGEIKPLLRLRKDNRIRSIRSSVAIEANSLSLDQVTDIINGKEVVGDPREIQEVKNAWKAYQKIGKYRPYSLEDLLKAHTLMSNKLVRESGRFRSMQVGVYNGLELIHDGAAPEEIADLMRKTFEWGVKSNAHPLIKSCVIHFLIEFIHPFEDGNGRMGRLWQTVILSDWHQAFSCVSVETMVYHNQFGYYDALQRSERDNDAACFVEFMLKIIDHTLRAITESKETKNHGALESEKLAGRAGKVGINVGIREGDVGINVGINARILALLKDQPSLTSTDLGILLQVSTRTIERRIKELREAGVLKRVGSNKTGYWLVLGNKGQA
jgi:Fic family protein